jgi:hypothetical protein
LASKAEPFTKKKRYMDFETKEAGRLRSEANVPFRLIIVLPASIQLDPESLENNTGSYLPVTGYSIIRVFNG